MATGAATPRAHMAALFRTFDTRGDGFLSIDEIKAIFTMGGGGLDDMELEATMEQLRAYDKRGDGQLEINEITAAFADSAVLSCYASLPTAPKLELPSGAESIDTDKWSVVSWLEGTGVHRVVAAALLQAMKERNKTAAAPADELSFLRELGGRDNGRDDLARILSTGPLLEGILDLVWSGVQELKKAGAATTDEIQSKFAGAIELSYGGLDAFYGGLERVVGAPNPKIREAMEAEHLDRKDSTQEFTTGNYGVVTTSAAEYRFVADEDEQKSLKKLERGTWAVEAVEKLPDRSRCRKYRPPTDFCADFYKRNEQLAEVKQPELVWDEFIGGRLYTGPMFVKYNGVLRGLQSDSDFLKNTMVRLCCPQETFLAFIGETSPDKLFMPPENGSISFDDAKRDLNRYTTTLHAINSAIIKLGKLTVAEKVYRGIAGMQLPEQFWNANECVQPNHSQPRRPGVRSALPARGIPACLSCTPHRFNVRGGIEPAFMSTTLQRDVAMHYAAGGIVLEAQMGMVDRGADMSWLSQARVLRCPEARAFMWLASGAGCRVCGRSACARWPQISLCVCVLRCRAVPARGRDIVRPVDRPRSAGRARCGRRRRDRVRPERQPDGADAGAGARQAAQGRGGHVRAAVNQGESAGAHGGLVRDGREGFSASGGLSQGAAMAAGAEGAGALQ